MLWFVWHSFTMSLRQICWPCSAKFMTTLYRVGSFMLKTQTFMES